MAAARRGRISGVQGNAKRFDLKTVTWRDPARRWRRDPPAGFIRLCEHTLTDRPPAG